MNSTTAPFSEKDLAFMRRALELAKIAASKGEVPVGALLVKNSLVISEAYNLRESTNQAIAHAEILALQQANEKLGAWRLIDCQLYVTLEPCLMCCGALLQARLSRVIYGAKDPKGGAAHSLYQTLNDPRLNHRVDVRGGLLESECSQILSQFFKDRRRSSDL